MLATALFRAKGRPARARCGFARYLAYLGFYEDHWVCEYWDAEKWVILDAQIDPFQQSSFQNYANTQKNFDPGYKQMLLTLDPLNVSSQHFIDAGTAWKKYRAGKVDPNTFGIGADPKEFGLKLFMDHGLFEVKSFGILPLLIKLRLSRFLYALRIS